MNHSLIDEMVSEDEAKMWSASGAELSCDRQRQGHQQLWKV